MKMSEADKGTEMLDRLKKSIGNFFAESGDLIKTQARKVVPQGVQEVVGLAVHKKSRITAALLAVFLGGIGGHYFYLGRNGRGLLCVAFCWTMLPTLGGLIHGFAWMRADDAQWALKWDRA